MIIRRDSPVSSTGVAKLTFPIDAFNQEQKDRLTGLVTDCQSARFRYKGEDVLEKSYRKATKMDLLDFCVDFCPYELGIVDMIAQVLLPNARTNIATKGVKAELYKLNVLRPSLLLSFPSLMLSHRITMPHPASSRPTSTHRAPSYSLGLCWSLCCRLTWAVSLLYDKPDNLSRLIGASQVVRITAMTQSIGLPSTETASMR